tara:strand:+ start:498 stop:713 length:216 start_codon:yes stop_codon:yes gene_type:complete
MVLPEDTNNAVVDALNRIHEALEDNNDVLKRIANHYDSVVPVMKRNADAIEESREDNRSPLDKMYESVFRS